MLRAILLSAALAFLACGAFAADDLMPRSRVLFKPVPQQMTDLPDNPLTPAKVDLGRKLFFDPRLSASQLISCNTCHNVGLGGVDLQETSIGHHWQKGPRNAPTVFNAVFNLAQFWDGRARDLAEQAKGPIQAAVEMNSTPEQVLATLSSIPEYGALFAKAFPQEKNPVSFDSMARAIEAFEATLLTPDAPFDRYLLGESKALGAQELAGLRLFLDKGCGSCHNGVNVGGSGYFPFGVREVPAEEILPPGDKGRYQVTNTASDQYVFKSPSLRNVELTRPYFHSGKVWGLADAVAIMGSAQLGIQLNERETAELVAFLRTLTGNQPRVEYPLLPPSGEDTPRPVLQ